MSCACQPWDPMLWSWPHFNIFLTSCNQVIPLLFQRDVHNFLGTILHHEVCLGFPAQLKARRSLNLRRAGSARKWCGLLVKPIQVKSRRLLIAKIIASTSQHKATCLDTLFAIRQEMGQIKPHSLCANLAPKKCTCIHLFMYAKLLPMFPVLRRKWRNLTTIVWSAWTKVSTNKDWRVVIACVYLANPTQLNQRFGSSYWLVSYTFLRFHDLPFSSHILISLLGIPDIHTAGDTPSNLWAERPQKSNSFIYNQIWNNPGLITAKNSLIFWKWLYNMYEYGKISWTLHQLHSDVSFSPN